MEPAKTIGQKIKLIRDSQNLSQTRFGYKIGVSGKTISAYENGRINPPYKIIKKISQVFNFPIYEIPSKHQVNLITKVQDLENSINQIKELLSIEYYEES